MLIIGIDLAWGDKKPDGVCTIEAAKPQSRVVSFAYPHGDEDLVAYLDVQTRSRQQVLITIDAPIICPNRRGTRPVDRLTHTLFHREHAACHPANSTKCPRPPRILARLSDLGIYPGWRLRPRTKVVAEVYPHPAMVRLFRLPRIIKYKRGSVSSRRREFTRLQQLIRACIAEAFPYLCLNREATLLLQSPWSKPVEDKTDALFCSLIGLWHWHFRGTRSEVLGDLETGFILLPEDLRK